MLDDLRPHIKDLRKRIIISTLSIVVMFFVSFSFWKILLRWIIHPVEKYLPSGSAIIFTKLQEPLITALRVSLFSAIVLSLPIILWQLWLFIAPGLYAKEKKIIIPFVFFATLMFVVGCIFCYYLVIPFGFRFLINFGSELFKALPSISEYVKLFLKLLFGFGIAFEFPVVVLFLAKIGLITDRTLIDFFKYAIVLIFVVSALLTPPDVLTQFLMAGPLVMLYGISILIARVINPQNKDKNKN